MKWLLIALFLPVHIFAQSAEDLKGIVYTNELTHTSFKNYIRTAEKEDTGGYWCIVYTDTLKEVSLITIQKENKGTYTIQESWEIKGPRKGNELIAGLAERREAEAGYTFVVSMERIPDGDNVALASSKAVKAWAFNKNSRRFEELKARKVTRIGESYMWK